MKINHLISKAKFCSVTERDFVFDDDSRLHYYCCKKIANKECDNKCIQCKSIYARYVVVDLRDKKIEEICKQKLFESMERFANFQEDYLSEIFFYETDNIRYNIYLIFICESQEIVKEYIDFSFDINYARKLFLTSEEFEEFFCFYNTIQQRTTALNHTLDQELLQALEKIVYKLDSKGIKSFLIKDDMGPLLEHFLFSFGNNQVLFDFRSGIKDNVRSFVEKYICQKEGTRHKNEKNVQFVNSMKLTNFREECFGESQFFHFGIANIIYGANTVGKTSLLDAIEFGYTGETHRLSEVEVDFESKVEIEDKNGNHLSSTEAKRYTNELKAMWYPYKIGTLSDLFGRINYFDTDATYRFALEQGNEQEAYVHIKNLLSTSKLIDMEMNLMKNIEHISKIKIIIEREDLFFKPYIKLDKSRKKFWNIFKRNARKPENLYKINDKKLTGTKQELDEFYKLSVAALDTIQELIDKQIRTNLELLNIIFRRLYSSNCQIEWDSGIFKMKSLYSDELITIDRMSTAQKVNLALSVIFTQFFLAVDAPKIILLDESVVNFDAFHLLNLFDFLREFTLNGVQIFFTTANEDIAKIAKSKLGFLGDECHLYQLCKSSDGSTQIIKS